jgi:hypothetical protein
MAETSWFRRVWRWFWRQSRKDKIDVVAKLATVVIGLIAIASFVLSIKGCQNAATANRTAENAIETSRQHFIQINRPCVTLTPKKGSDGKYWHLTQLEKSIGINIRYEVVNVGNVIAKDIRLPDKVSLRLGARLEEASPVTYKKELGAFTLGPGQDCRVDMIQIIHFKTAEAAKQNLELLASDEKNGLRVSTAVDYGNELDKSQKYRTIVDTRFFSDRTVILKQEMLILNEGTDESEGN